MNKRLLTALASYLILGLIAATVLHGKILYGVLILFAGLAAKTLIAARAGW